MHHDGDTPAAQGRRWLAALACALSFTGGARAAEPLLELRTAQQSGSIGKYAAAGQAALPGQSVQPAQPAQPGLCMEILRAVERVDPGLRFTGLNVHAPLRRIERMLAEGEIDVFFCLLKSPERERQWRYLPVPLYRIRHMAVQRSDDATELRSFADLAVAGQRKPVLVMKGTLLQQALARAGVSTSEPPSEREALQMLMMGRADVVYGQDVNLLRNLRDSGFESRLRVSPTVFSEDIQYATAAARLPARTVQRLTRALQMLERDGTLKALAEKYR